MEFSLERGKSGRIRWWTWDAGGGTLLWEKLVQDLVVARWWRNNELKASEDFKLG